MVRAPSSVATPLKLLDLPQSTVRSRPTAMALCMMLAAPSFAGAGTEQREVADGAGAVLDVLERSAVLGSGAQEVLYPTDLDSFYSEEAGWTRLGGL